MPFSDLDLYKMFDDMGLSVTKTEHAPLYTVEDSQNLRGDIKGGHCKNLFLKSKKGILFLVVVLEDWRVDLKQLEKQLGAGRLSFGKPDLLMEKLGIIPGAVTPFSAINDLEKEVTVILDQEMMTYDLLNYHPLRNDRTVTISNSDLRRFLTEQHQPPVIMDIPQR